MLPLRDNIPTSRTPYVTYALIVANVLVYFFWQQGGITLGDPSSAHYICQLQDWAAIPYEITHPGDQVQIAPGCRRARRADVPDDLHRHVHARRPAAPRRQHAVPVDLRQQRRGRHGPGQVHVFYLLAGVAALALQIVIDPSSQVPTLGASGAIAGVLGGYLLLFPQARVVTVIFIVFFFTILELPALLVLGIWFLQQAVFGYFDLAQPAGQGGGVAYFAHIGGFVFGLAAVRLFASRKRVDDQTEPDGLLAAVRWLAASLAAARRCWSRSAAALSTSYLRESPQASPRRSAPPQAPPGPLQDSGHRAAGRRRHRALAARGPARPAGRHASASSFKKPPRSALLFDLDTGRVLYRRDPTRVLPIASLTKMMTALVVVERVPPGSKVRITNEALRYQGSGVGLLPRGKWIGVNTMLYGLMLPSGNDAAIALAQRAAGGSVKRFVRYMNEKAEEMGLLCTRFAHARAASRTRATTRAPPTSRRSPAPCCASRGWRGSSRKREAVAPVPDQGRPAVPLQPQPAAAPGLPRHDGAEDRLHGRRGALPGGHRAARADQARRRPAELARPRQAGDAAARPRLQSLRRHLSG